MDIQILVFRTSISTRQDVRRVGKVLDACSQIKKWNVDFEDWGKVLRIEAEGIETEEIAAMLREINIHIAELE